MAIFSADERAELERALEGSGIFPANLDNNLVGVIKALVGMSINRQQQVMDHDLDAEVLRTAGRELERQLREVAGQCDGYRQAVWCLVRRSNGIVHLDDVELAVCPAYPPVTVIQSIDPPGWDIVCELPEVPGDLEEVAKEEN